MAKMRVCLLRAALFASAALMLSVVPALAARQTSAPKKTTTSSKARKRGKARPRAQMAPTADRIREIQSALKREGSLNGAPTGKWDAATIEAMKKFQAGHGFNPTGKIDALTLEKLGLGSDTAGKGAPGPPASSVQPNSDPGRQLR
jgi:peptidoglycan hydrolase-like protein with peptidoglycan-binding domain